MNAKESSSQTICEANGKMKDFDQQKQEQQQDAEGQEQKEKKSSTIQGEESKDLATEGLSKNKLRKLKRMQALEARKQELRAKKKAEKQKSREERRQANADRLKTMSEEEIQALRSEKARKIEERRQEKQDKRNRLLEAMKSGQKIVIDVDFGELMSEKECRSLVQQLSYSYSANCRASVPAHLIVTGVHGMMADTLAKQIAGYENWSATVMKESYLDHFKGQESNLVYLTADSDHELQELDPSKTYIVGGLVDRNRYKGVCLEKAQSQNIATARLPIGEFMQLKSSQVMCTNHVVEMLIKWLEVKNWEIAFRSVIPIRKRKADNDDAKDVVVEKNKDQDFCIDRDR